jgi:branched-chain amino acid transport system ATP-binding protein
MALLELEDVAVSYGNIAALRGVSMAVEDGEIVALIGANGAGKSTLIKAVAGLLRSRQGDVRYAGRTLKGLDAARVARLGLAVVPEARRLFGAMSVAENLELGAFVRGGARREDLEEVLTLFPRLAERLPQKAATLSGGEQQMLAIGRALMARPRLVLMDEPSIGLAPLMVQAIFAAIARLREQGRTILLVEQNARLALRLADRAYVLELGRVTLAGKASELAAMDRIRELYLGA